jgi:hypothetical protein
MLATTAITMVITPLLLVLNEKLILKYFGVKTRVKPIIKTIKSLHIQLKVKLLLLVSVILEIQLVVC